MVEKNCIEEIIKIIKNKIISKKRLGKEQRHRKVSHKYDKGDFLSDFNHLSHFSENHFLKMIFIFIPFSF